MLQHVVRQLLRALLVRPTWPMRNSGPVCPTQSQDANGVAIGAVDLTFHLHSIGSNSATVAAPVGRQLLARGVIACHRLCPRACIPGWAMKRAHSASHHGEGQHRPPRRRLLGLEDGQDGLAPGQHGRQQQQAYRPRLAPDGMKVVDKFIACPPRMKSARRCESTTVAAVPHEDRHALDLGSPDQPRPHFEGPSGRGSRART